MKYECVFLDMDGVLCNFIKAAHETHGREYVHEEYPRGVWEIANHWGIPVDDFWAGIDRNFAFWEDMEAYPWVDELIALARSAGDEVKLLTSPSKSPLCFYGKRAWATKHIPHDIELIICKSKHLLATPARLLIDDGDHNVKPWRKAGGDAILFPQPWNEAHANSSDPVEITRFALEVFTTLRGNHANA